MNQDKRANNAKTPADRAFERFRIIASMNTLAKTTPFDDMTVAQICQQAQTSRASFYRLFSDKFEAANWFMSRCLDLGDTQIGRTYSWYEGYQATFSAEAVMRDMLVAAGKSHGYSGLTETTTRQRRHDLIETLARWHSVKADDELLFQIDSIVCIEGMTSQMWLGSAMNWSVETLAARIASCVPPRLFALLNKPASPQVSPKFDASSLMLEIAHIEAMRGDAQTPPPHAI